MTCRTTGYGMLMSSSPQGGDGPGRRRASVSAIKGAMRSCTASTASAPRTRCSASRPLDYEDLRGLVDQKALQEFRRQSLNPEHPTNRGNNVNPDIYFQCKEGANVKAAIVPDTIQHYMDEINKLTGRDSKLFNYYGAPDAEEVIVVMCSASEAVKETVDYLNAHSRKVGMVQIHLYRPFSVKHFAAAIPASVKKIAVLDRSKGDRFGRRAGIPRRRDRPSIRQAGTTSRSSAAATACPQDTRASSSRSTTTSRRSSRRTTSPSASTTTLPTPRSTTPRSSCRIRVRSAASCGVSAATARSARTRTLSRPSALSAASTRRRISPYDTMKSGGLTQSHLRFGDEPILSTYLVNSADFVAVHAPTYVKKYDVTADLKDGGTFLLNCPWSVEELEAPPGEDEGDLARKHANFYIIDAAKLAAAIGLGKRTNNILQGRSSR